jgi:mono/diheme cytochrome c family protein
MADFLMHGTIPHLAPIEPMRLALLLMCLLILQCGAEANDELNAEFATGIRPLLDRYCLDCHQGTAPEGDLDLSVAVDLDAVTKDFRRWMVVADRVEAGEMPPEDAAEKLSDQQRNAIVAWVARVRDIEARRTSGDPGIVSARRLSNAEYNHTIRDLIGFDLQPASTFPVDPANEAGFDNSAESLSMSPSLVKKYVDAARQISEHMVLTPTGITFAPHPVITNTDRDKFCVNRIIDFYRRQNTDYADYLMVLWRFRNRDALGLGQVGIAEWAESHGISQRYATTLWDVLEGSSESVGPIAAIQAMWRELPTGGDRAMAGDALAGCLRIKEFIESVRQQLVPQVDNLTTPQVHDGSQPLVLWKNRQFVANRQRYAGGAAELVRVPVKPGSAAAKAMQIPDDENLRAAYEAAFEPFCRLFPDRFFVSERARVYLNPEEEKKLAGRYLSAGFHSQMGYFRDDAPLVDLMLDDDDRALLDQLWLELDFVASAPSRQYTGFIWFDRTDSQFMRDPEFDRYRAEDKDCTSAAKVIGLKTAYVDKARRVGGNERAIQAIERYFDDMLATFQRLEQLRREAEPIQLQALVQFAEKAYRRPLSDADRWEIIDFYRTLCEAEGLSHEDAIRDCLVRILVSPNFCYRVDLTAAAGRNRNPDAEKSNPQESNQQESAPEESAPQESAIEPLDDYALANRLSYFLWSSMPDRQLMDAAADGRLSDRDQLVRQTQRMIQDPRARGFALEFLGNWLDFRRFEAHNGVDRGRFPQFDDGLRSAMFEEPLKFFIDAMQRDASILDLLDADYTFVNDELAEHYGMPPAAVGTGGQNWRRVDDAGRYGRGGLLPMAVFLTTNSPGLRTSPVKRGNWIVQRVLGEHIPAPPATVPELPADESQLGELTLRQTLERHRADASCAVCHRRIDAFGLVFEGYGPVGERRNDDLAGKPIDDSAEFPDGATAQGLEGLRAYIETNRRDDFVDNFVRKMVAYALGRSLQLSDEVLIDRIGQRLRSEQYRMGVVFETIVTDPAFTNKRVRAL